MLRSAKPFALCCVLLTVAAAAYAKDDGHDKDRAFITQAVKDMDTATNNKDTDGYVKYFGAEFTVVDQNAKVTTLSKEDIRKATSQMNARAASIDSRTTIDSFDFNASGITVTEKNTVDLVLTAHGEQRMIKDVNLFRNLWVKSGDGWQQQSSVTLTTALTINGQPAK